MRRRWAEAAGLAAASAVVFGAGLCRTIYVGDSGELVAAVHTLGVPHPSGYPLYVFLGKLWSLLLPVGSAAERMSWFSVAAAAVTVGVIYLLGRRLDLGRAAAALAAATVALGPSFWSQANIQRVYALNALFVASSLLAATIWFRERDRRWLWASFLLCGLGAANHTFMALQAVAVGFTALLAMPAVRRQWRTWIGAGVAFGVGLTPYLLLMLRSRADPRLDWGDPETPWALIRHVLRLTHWSRAWLESWADAGTILADYARGLGGEVLWFGLPLALAGVVWARRRQWPTALMLAIMAVNLVALAGHGSHADIFIWHRYYIPSYLVVALLIGAGAQWLAESRWRRAHLLLWLLPVALLVVGWRPHDRSRYALGEEYSRLLLAELPPGAHLAASDDNILFVLIYLDLVEGARPDVNLIMQGVGDARLPPLRFNPGSDDLFFTHHPNWSVPGIELVPAGLTFRVATSGSESTGSNLPEFLPGELDPRVPKDYLTQNLIGNFHYMKGLGYESTQWAAALIEFERAARAAPSNDVLFYNLGLILQRNDRLQLARLAFVRADAINPRGIVSNRTARAADRIGAVEAQIAGRGEESRAATGPPGQRALEAQLAAAMAVGGHG